MGLKIINFKAKLMLNQFSGKHFSSRSDLCLLIIFLKWFMVILSRCLVPDGLAPPPGLGDRVTNWWANADGENVVFSMYMNLHEFTSRLLTIGNHIIIVQWKFFQMHSCKSLLLFTHILISATISYTVWRLNALRWGVILIMLYEYKKNVFLCHAERISSITQAC